jgi:hypothetical protein
MKVDLIDEVTARWALLNEKRELKYAGLDPLRGVDGL